jgi:hypothetical protein
MHGQQVNILDFVKSLRDDITGLIRDEVALAKTEIGEKVATASRNVGYLAVGALVAYAGLIFLLVAVSFTTEKISEIAGKVGEIAHKVTEEAGKAAEKENLVPEALKKA